MMVKASEIEIESTFIHNGETLKATGRTVAWQYLVGVRPDGFEFTIAPHVMVDDGKPDLPRAKAQLAELEPGSIFFHDGERWRLTAEGIATGERHAVHVNPGDELYDIGDSIYLDKSTEVEVESVPEPKPEATPAKPAPNALTIEQIANAFIYRDHMGEGWYCYAPTANDSLDAEGSIHARTFDTHEEAFAFFRRAFFAAAFRPHADGFRMIDVDADPK